MINLEIFKDKSIQSDAVNARDLWEGLESKQEFANWIRPKVVNNPLFVENEDWCLLDKVVNKSDNQSFRPKAEYALPKPGGTSRTFCRVVGRLFAFNLIYS